MDYFLLFPLFFLLDNFLFSFMLFFSVYCCSVKFCWFGLGSIPTNSSVMLVFLVLCTFLMSLPLLKSESFYFKLLVIISLVFFKSGTMLFLYTSFEACLVPIALIIFFFGYQPERVSASFYLFLYGLISGLPMIFLLSSNKFDSLLVGNSVSVSSLFFWVGTLGFLVKSPLFFFHVWLPKAHVEAPTLGSVMLAGILLKQGTYGCLVVLSLFKHYYLMFYFFLACLGSCFCVFMVFLSTDLKAWVALSSVVHMNVLLAGVFTFSVMAKESSIFIMFFHGIVSSLMFIGAGSLIHSYQARIFFVMSNLSGLEQKMLAMVFFSNMGVPPFLTFVFEVIQVSCIFSFSYLLGIFWFMNFLGVSYYCLFISQIFSKNKSVPFYFSSSLMLSFSFFLLFLINFFFLTWGF